MWKIALAILLTVSAPALAMIGPSLSLNAPAIFSLQSSLPAGTILNPDTLSGLSNPDTSAYITDPDA